MATSVAPSNTPAHEPGKNHWHEFPALDRSPLLAKLTENTNSQVGVFQ